jgi:hypothetical protein
MKTSIAMALKTAAAVIIYFPGQVAANAAFPLSAGLSAIPAEQAGLVLPALLAVGTLYSFILHFAARRSHLPLPKLIAAMGAVFYLVNTFQNQIETWYFRSAFPMIGEGDLGAFFLRGLLVTAIWVPSSLVLFRAGRPVAAERAFGLAGDWWKYLLAALAFVPVYLGFGFIAQLTPVLREVYAGWIADPLPTALLPLWQVFRGAVFTGIACLVFVVFATRRAALAGALLVFPAFMAAELFLPSAIMPPALRLVHTVEIVTSMSLWAWIAWRLLVPRAASGANPAKAAVAA